MRGIATATAPWASCATPQLHQQLDTFHGFSAPLLFLPLLTQGSDLHAHCRSMPAGEQLPTYLPTYQPTYLRTYQPTYLPTNQPTNLPTNLRSFEEMEASASRYAGKHAHTVFAQKKKPRVLASVLSAGTMTPDDDDNNKENNKASKKERAPLGLICLFLFLRM